MCSSCFSLKEHSSLNKHRNPGNACFQAVSVARTSARVNEVAGRDELDPITLYSCTNKILHPKQPHQQDPAHCGMVLVSLRAGLPVAGSVVLIQEEMVASGLSNVPLQDGSDGIKKLL